MNRVEYGDIPEEKSFTSQQDTNPEHTANATLEWLNIKNLNVLDRPSQSTESSDKLIENVWPEYFCSPATIECSPGFSDLTKLEQFCKSRTGKNIRILMCNADRGITQKARSHDCSQR